jgi:cytochrome c oxidase cbb3-type subunit I/II
MLKYPNFLETVTQIKHMYLLRAIGGAMYLIGVFVMVYNLIATANQGSFVKNEEAEAAVEDESHAVEHKGEHWHRWIERHPVQMLVFSLIVVAIGGLIEIIPTYLVKSNIPTISSVKPYTALELEGRDIYIREGCNTCHSQMVRPFRSETQRYGEYSKAGEFVYDHPFLWGSKRTGPDLHRVGGKYGDLWHFNHMLSPEITSSGSIMPAYPHLLEKDIDYTTMPSKISAMRTLGVPYAEGYEQVAVDSAKAQAVSIVKNLDTESSGKVKANANKEIIAMIAYLQRLGKDIKLAPKNEE